MSEAANSAIDEESKKVMFLESVKQELGIDLPRACGYQLIVRVHERAKELEEKNKRIIDLHESNSPSGNIILSPESKDKDLAGKLIVLDKSLEHDKYTRKVGQVLAIGPIGYKGDKYNGVDPYCKIGDWIVFPSGCGTEMLYGGIPCRILNDDKCLVIVDDPNYVD